MVVTKLVLDSIRLSYVYRENGDAWGRHTDEMIVGYALLHGTLQGKYIGVQKVSNMTGLPKSSVHRRIEDLCRAGVAHKSPTGRGFMVSAEVLNAPQTIAALSQISHAIAKASAELSKLEPLPTS